MHRCQAPSVRRLLVDHHPRLLSVTSFAVAFGLVSQAEAAKVVSVSVLDQEYLMVHVLDGEVLHELEGEQIQRYSPELDTTAATQASSFTLTSAEDSAYGEAGQQPTSVSRKSKISGQAQLDWGSSDYNYDYTHQHWLYLRLPTPLVQGSTYELEIAEDTNCDDTSFAFTYDIFSSTSEAVHVNLVGYAPDAPHKAADLYHWMGDGGARDYSSFEGNTVYLYDVENQESHEVGQVTFWKPDQDDVFYYDVMRSSVWNVDFSSFSGSGTYRLAVEGVGCSQDFLLDPGVYWDPFAVSVRGFYYMRIGQDNSAGLTPAARTPLYIPGESPADTTVYLTTMQPWHAEWDSFAGGDKWDAKDQWAAYRKPGNPTNPDAYGGHSDAADWDRHLGHVSIIYDMLLPFILTGGAIDDDDTGIAESGNGIPDIIDEARYEVDFWLRLRDGDGYSHGLNNPNGDDVFYQAGPTAIAAWANSVNAAMLADSLRLAGQEELSNQYRDAAVEAYEHADGLADPMLDEEHEVGYAVMLGRDLKMTAAAYLYNVTGDEAYEAVVANESVCTNANAQIAGEHMNQTWATAGYLMTPQTVNYPTLYENMRASVISDAKEVEAGLIDDRPSRRATDDWPAYFRTSQNVQRTLIAHAVAEDQADKDLFRKALALEADWGLGRNPLNMIEMTTAHSSLSAKRSCEYIYTMHTEDGRPVLVPGQTPYLNLDDWSPGMVMGTPSKLYEQSYPRNFLNTWPVGEAYFNTPWVWAYSEFTPQQTMRGKTALYGYLYGLGVEEGGSHPEGTGGTGGSGGASGTGGRSANTGGGGAGGRSSASGGDDSTSGGRSSTSGGRNSASGGDDSTRGGDSSASGGDDSAPGGDSSASGGRSGDTVVTCQSPLSLCDASCVNLETDPLHCGDCDSECSDDQVCSEGACASTCGPGLAQCGRLCVDLDADLLNCGDCDVACRQGQRCEDGSCVGEATSDDSAATPIEEPAPDSKDSGGCGCRQASAPTGSLGAWAWGALLLAAGLRRRRLAN